MPKIQLPGEWQQEMDRRNASDSAGERELLPWRPMLDQHAPASPLPSSGGNLTGFLHSRSADFHARSSFLASVVIMSIFLVTTLGATAVLLAFCRKRNTVFALATNDARSQYELAHMDDDLSECSSKEDKDCARSKTYPEFPQSRSTGDLCDVTQISPAPRRRSEQRISGLNGSANFGSSRQSEPTLPLLPRSHTVTFPVRNKHAQRAPRAGKLPAAPPGMKQGEVIGKFCAMTSRQTTEQKKSARKQKALRADDWEVGFPSTSKRIHRGTSPSAFRPYNASLGKETQNADNFGCHGDTDNQPRDSSFSLRKQVHSFHRLPSVSPSEKGENSCGDVLGEFPKEQYDIFSHVCMTSELKPLPPNATARAIGSRELSQSTNQNFPSSTNPFDPQHSSSFSVNISDDADLEVCQIQEGDLAACPGLCHPEQKGRQQGSRSFDDEGRSKVARERSDVTTRVSNPEVHWIDPEAEDVFLIDHTTALLRK